MQINKILILFGVVIGFMALLFTYNFIKYPEIYITTWRYQLQNDLKSGDEAAIEYYQRVYINSGKELFKK